MRKLFIIFFILSSLGSFAHGKTTKVPTDFYVTKQGDTVNGKIFVGLKNVFFTFPDKRKIKLHPDSVLSFSYYTGDASVPAKYVKNYINTVLSFEGRFFDIYYTGNGPVRILFEDKVVISGGGPMGIPMPVDDDIYYFERKGVLTRFHATGFRAAVMKYMADCPDMVEYLDNVPDSKKSDDTHLAKFSDASAVMDKYDKCISRK